jgi:hypothetical protein
MRTFLLLLILILAGAWFYPPYAEEAPNACAAFEKKFSVLAQAEAKKIVPAQRSNDSRVNALMDMMKAVLAGSNGVIAEAYLREKFPQFAQLPPSVGCIGGYWYITFNPDLSQYVKSKTAVAKP